jgi:alkanesulfonate monooxygenase SsuD/methylene tetrahydromethanopterin reductase-like flavin-dependent oxidoreductase (luciferase family)
MMVDLKTQPISFRPSESLSARLDAMRDRTGIPKSQLIELLADEAERTRRYPGLAFRGPDQARRAWLVGSPFDVWEVIQAWQDLGRDSERVRQRLELSPRQLTLVLAYYREFPEEIDSALRSTRRTLPELEASYPFIEVFKAN